MSLTFTVSSSIPSFKGPTFLDNVDYREYAFNSFGAVAVDMESASAAHVCTQMGKKFIFVRSLSDLVSND